MVKKLLILGVAIWAVLSLSLLSNLSAYTSVENPLDPVLAVGNTAHDNVVVNFPDAILKAEVNKLINPSRPSTQDIMIGEIKSIAISPDTNGYFNFKLQAKKNFSNLEGIQFLRLTNINRLFLQNNNISNIEPLQQFDNINLLYLDDNPIPTEQLSYLANLQNILSLGLSNKHIRANGSHYEGFTSIDNLPKLPKLITLGLSHHNKINLESLKFFPKLKGLFIGKQNRKNDQLVHLVNIPRLKIIHGENNRFYDISLLNDGRKWTKLDLPKQEQRKLVSPEFRKKPVNERILALDIKNLNGDFLPITDGPTLENITCPNAPQYTGKKCIKVKGFGSNQTASTSWSWTHPTNAQIVFGGTLFVDHRLATTIEFALKDMNKSHVVDNQKKIDVQNKIDEMNPLFDLPDVTLEERDAKIDEIIEKIRLLDYQTPAVAIGNSALISSTNQATYPVTGTCTADAGDVTATIGNISKVVPCNGGTFSDTVDVSTLADGNVTIDASQTWRTQLEVVKKIKNQDEFNETIGNAPQVTVIKDTTGPVIVVANPNIDPESSKIVSASVNPTTDGTVTHYAEVYANADCPTVSPYTAGNSVTLTAEYYNGKKICFRAEDPHGNVSFTESNIIDGIDVTKPIIAGTSTVTMKVGSIEATSYDIKNGITVQDGSMNLTDALNCISNPNYNANAVADYTVTCTVADEAGNDAVPFVRTIKITAIDKSSLAAKIQSAKDARDNQATVADNNKDNLNQKITEAETALTNPNLTEAQRDTLITELDDLTNKLTRNSDAPMFGGDTALDYKVGSPEALSLVSSQTVGITVTDTIDGTMTPNCTTTPAYNANQVGTYTVSCTATDSQNYTTTFTRTITISSIDKQPLQTKIDEAKTKIADPKVINNQAKTDLQNKITEAENTLNDDNLTTAKRDELIAQLTDLISKIKRDTIPPLFNPTNPAKIITRKGTPVNLNDVTVDDGVGASGIDANGIVMTTSPNLDANNPAKGNYTVTYSATDNAGNNTTVHREVEITDADELQAEVNKVTPALLNGKTPDSVKAVNDAKKEAEDVINNPTASQHDIDDALDTLKKAIQNLRTIQSSQPSTPSIGGGGYVVPAPTTPKQPTVPTQPVAPTPPTQPTPVPHPQVQPSLPVGEIGVNPQQLFNPSFEGSCYAPTHRSTIHQDIEVTEAFTQAHQMLYNYQLTRWQGDADFRPYSTLTREEAARFMVEFAEKVLCRTKTRKYDGRFVDIGVSNPTLTPFIRASYEYEIFNGDKSDTTTTTFRPKDRLSEEELVVIIVRLITNEILEEGEGEHWAMPYYSSLRRYSALTQFSNSQRGVVAEMIYDLYRNNDYMKKTVGYVITKRKSD